MELTEQDITAFDQVKNAVSALRTEYKSVCANIVAIEKQIAELPLLPVPIEDLKAAVLDFVDARGQDYLEEDVKNSIKNFATNMMCGSGIEQNLMGKPIRFKELEMARTGNNGAMSVAQLITQFGKGQFNDLALYAFFSELVKAGLSNVMATMTDGDFGYSGLSPVQIGTDRATRRAAIQSAQERLAALLASKVKIADSLRQLGISVSN